MRLPWLIMHKHFTTLSQYIKLAERQFSESTKFIKFSQDWLESDAGNLFAAAITGRFFYKDCLDLPQKSMAIYQKALSLTSNYLEEIQVLNAGLNKLLVDSLNRNNH